MLWWLLIILLVVLLVAALPAWDYNSGRNWGYYPSGIFAVVAILLLIIVLVGVV